MSIFSEHLNILIQKKKLTLPYLEAESGLSTALISKIKTGKRLPDSEEKMVRLIRALHCTPEKEGELLKEYRIEKIGREKYLCMEELRKILESLSHDSLQLAIDKKTEYALERKQLISGESNILTVFQYLVETELSRPTGFLKIYQQLEHSFPEEYLIQAITNANHQDFYLEHLVSLREPDNDPERLANIKIASKCLRLAYTYRNQYHAFYSYRTESSAEFFPYCILTSQQGLLISADYQQALFLWEDETLDSLNRMFEGLKSKCRPLFQIAEDMVGYLQGYNQSVWDNTAKMHHTVSFSYVPCILPTIPPEIAMERINPALKNSPVMDYLNRYWTEVSYTESVNIFSLKGLELFMQTGICYELPDGYGDAFTVEERVTIMNLFIQKVEQGKIIPILIKDNQIKLSSKLSITLYDSRYTTFMWNLPQIPFSSCFILEDGIQIILSDFLSYIRQNEEDTYSVEESLALIKAFMKKYETP